MKKLGDWDDDLIDLDDESEEQYEDDYTEDYDDEDMPLPNRRTVIAVVAAALVLIVAVICIALVVVMKPGNKTEPVTQMEQMSEEPGMI